ncbi:MAG: DUF4412 domain-containing protein [Candidatus Bipolaricaulia bacterium]
MNRNPITWLSTPIIVALLISIPFRSGFPLRVVDHPGETEPNVTEVTQVEQVDLDPSIFELPEGYAQVMLIAWMGMEEELEELEQEEE